MFEEDVQEDVQEEESLELRDVLEAAIDEDAATTSDEDGEVSEPINEPTGEPEPNTQFDAEGTSPTSEPAGAEEAGAKGHKAPAGWSPKSREQWSKVPSELQAEISNREKQVAQLMEQTKGSRTLHQEADKFAQTYAPVLQAEGITHPLEAAQSYAQTVNTLRAGTANEKAGMVAEIINKYGVDISTLDQLLVNGGAAQQPAAQGLPPELDQMLNQRLAPVDQLLSTMQQAQQMKAQQEKQQASQEIASFQQEAEFLNDVRMQMADIIDIKAAQGQQMGLKEAYDLACQLNPQIKQVLDERAKNEQLMGSQNTMQRKQAAASSLNGRRGGQPSYDPNASLTDAIANAWDEVERR